MRLLFFYLTNFQGQSEMNDIAPSEAFWGHEYQRTSYYTWIASLLYFSKPLRFISSKNSTIKFSLCKANLVLQVEKSEVLLGSSLTSLVISKDTLELGAGYQLTRERCIELVELSCPNTMSCVKLRDEATSRNLCVVHSDTQRNARQ